MNENENIELIGIGIENVTGIEIGSEIGVGNERSGKGSANFEKGSVSVNGKSAIDGLLVHREMLLYLGF